MLGGLSVCIVAWRLANGSHYSLNGFLNYITQAGSTNTLRGIPVTLGSWLSDRLISLGNTLVPLRLFLLSSQDQVINAVQAYFPFCHGGSAGIVHFFYQYWTGVPFGMAIAFFPLLLQSLWRAFRKWPWAITATVIVPFLVFTIYWGGASTGMVREGLHAWVHTRRRRCRVAAIDRLRMAAEHCRQGAPGVASSRGPTRRDASHHRRGASAVGHAIRPDRCRGGHHHDRHHGVLHRDGLVGAGPPFVNDLSDRGRRSGESWVC